jgi:hypothetical protein
MNIPTQLKALMAAGSVGACVALFGIMVFLARVVPTGGVEATVSTLIMIGSFVPAFLIGWASLVFTQQLFAEVKREKTR